MDCKRACILSIPSSPPVRQPETIARSMEEGHDEYGELDDDDDDDDDDGGGGDDGGVEGKDEDGRNEGGEEGMRRRGERKTRTPHLGCGE